MKIAVVTGSANGIGKATAELFQENGWLVYGLDKIKPKTKKEFRVDLGDEKQVKKIFEDIGGPINALVNNAGIQVCKSLNETTAEEWDQTMAVNLKSVFLCSKHAYPLLSEGSSIVNVSSVHAKATSRNIAAYAASKAAILGLTRAQAIEYAKKKIRVNAVLPGATNTRMLRKGLRRAGNEENALKKLIKKHPLGTIAEPQDIAHTILWLADPEKARTITGQTFTIDGGATAILSTEDMY